uniref:Uncharacterized protein n=1 Tax=Rhizophora mucronata TaxID=61149 RepID=A0A2P2QLH6_RHIMU
MNKENFKEPNLFNHQQLQSNKHHAAKILVKNSTTLL